MSESFSLSLFSFLTGRERGCRNGDVKKKRKREKKKEKERRGGTEDAIETLLCGSYDEEKEGKASLNFFIKMERKKERNK